MIALTNPVRWLDQVKKELLAVLCGLQQVLDDEREILGEPIIALEKPGLLLQPSLPFSKPDPLGWDRSAKNLLRINPLG
ncbi:MAG: hypothetical protein MUE84_08045 [Hyphomonas sp.]|nr:hypothetical protein [Hyphomonas sp.]